MSDLVQRLRDGEGDGLVGGCQGCYHAVMDEAADEIIMLRERTRAQPETINVLRAELTSAFAQIEQ